jgi:hypothetical protein
MMRESEIVAFPDRINHRKAESERMEFLAGELIGAYAELGLDVEFMPIFGQHIADLKLEVAMSGIDSTVTVSKTGPEILGEKSWQRKAIIGEMQLNDYAAGLFEALRDMNLLSSQDVDASDPKIKNVAASWILYELSADVLGSSCYMQRHYNRYIPDLNGQSPNARFDVTVSREFLSSYVDYDDMTLQKLAEYDHANFRAGVSLVFLEDLLLRMGLVDNVVSARWVSSQLKQTYPKTSARKHVEPMERDEITKRLIDITPTTGKIAWYHSFFDTLDLPDQD